MYLKQAENLLNITFFPKPLLDLRRYIIPTVCIQQKIKNKDIWCPASFRNLGKLGSSKVFLKYLALVHVLRIVLYSTGLHNDIRAKVMSVLGRIRATDSFIHCYHTYPLLVQSKSVGTVWLNK